MKKCLSLSMLIVGTIIGAGFASGREIVSFFGKNLSLWIAPICGVCFFLLCIMFLFLGSKIKKSNISDANHVFMGKFHVIADFFLLLNSLVVLAGMLSGMDSLFNMVYPIAPFYSIIAGILCAVVVSKGLRGLLKANSVIVPAIIILLIVICFLNISDTLNPQPFYAYSVPAVILYVSMNMMLACTFFVTVHDLSKKTIVLASLIASTILTILMLLLILAINSSVTQGYPMPVLEMAKNVSKPLFYLGVIVVAISIFTTMLTAMSSLSAWVNSMAGDELFSIAAVLIAGLIVSNLGFENVVSYLYPVIGILGVFYIIVCFIYSIRSYRRGRRLSTAAHALLDKGDNKIHRRSKKAKNDRRCHDKV